MTIALSPGPLLWRMFWCFAHRTSSGSLAMLVAMRLASSRVCTFAAGAASGGLPQARVRCVT